MASVLLGVNSSHSANLGSKWKLPEQEQQLSDKPADWERSSLTKAFEEL